jgi:hypothetical protein
MPRKITGQPSLITYATASKLSETVWIGMHQNRRRRCYTVKYCVVSYMGRSRVNDFFNMLAHISPAFALSTSQQHMYELH